MKKPQYVYKAHIDEVIDGDTFDVTVDLGFQITTYQRLRLVDIDTPEVRGPERPKGLKVKEYVKHLIEGKDVTIQSFKLGKFGRYTAEVFLEGDEKLSEHLLAGGMAVKSDYEG
ncbi:MAG: nuclease [Chloroflexi bacterium]|nr:nuclease [Chloroflexota bacterium]